MRTPRIAWAVTALVVAGPSAATHVEVVPGGIARWAGEGLTLCGRGSESWRPVGDSCWYPIDLLEAATALDVWRESGSARETARLSVADYPYPVQRITLKDDSRVHLSEADGARAARESERVGALWSARGPRQFTLPLGDPLERLPEGGRFGSRRFFNDQPRSPHTGADYAAATGTPVLSVAAGIVLMADDLFFSGQSVFVHHGDGLVSMYFHLSSLAVEEGQEVERGQVVGEVGATGRATGPHLHFGLRWRGARVDPAWLLGEVADVPRVGG